MFKKAERKKIKLKVAFTGPTGSGKTLAALLLAKGLGGKTAFIDTENGSASLYSDKFDFDVLDLKPPFTTEKYIEAIEFAEKSQYENIVIDSLTHAWAGEGGLLEQKALLDSRPGSNQWTNWGPIDKKDQALKNAYLHSSCHIISTMRSKMEYHQTEANGKKKIEKMGLAPIQRDGLSYEFSIVFDLAMDHNAEVSKDRTGLFDGKIFKITEDVGVQLNAWLNSGKAEKLEVKEPAKEPIKLAPEPKATKPPPKPLAMLSGMYMIQNGKLKGQFLKDIELDEIQNYLTDAEAYFEKQGGRPYGTIKDDMNAADNYLRDQAELLSLK